MQSINTPSTKTLDVFSLGLCRTVINIFDDRKNKPARAAYLQNYLPGPGWSARTDCPLDIFPYLHHAWFENGNC